MIVGIDWAVDANDRAAAYLRPGDGGLTLEATESPLSDARAVEICSHRGVELVAVDIPFGWPRDFGRFVRAWHAKSDGEYPEVPASVDFRYRTTDSVVKRETGKAPLSVSTNLFAMGARQWASIVRDHDLGPQVDCLGDLADARPRVVEVYPGATLAVLERDWGTTLTTRRVRGEGGGKGKVVSYKSDAETREALVETVLQRVGIALAERVSVAQVVDRGKKDHRTDALVAAATGAAVLGEVPGWEVRTPRPDETPDALREGWIFFPSSVDGAAQ